MKHLLLTTIAAVLLVATTAFADPIHDAANAGDLAAVQAQLDAGVDVNARDNHKWTPLTHAAQFGHKDIADLLISKGADVNAKEAKNQITPLHWAAWRGRKEIAELLIAKGADLNTKNKDGGTPLHNAAWKGHVEIAKLLIVKNADVNAKDVEGQTPLDWAEEEKHKEIADLLRKHGGKTEEELKAEGK
jgi:cytohesin